MEMVTVGQGSKGGATGGVEVRAHGFTVTVFIEGFEA